MQAEQQAPASELPENTMAPPSEVLENTTIAALPDLVDDPRPIMEFALDASMDSERMDVTISSVSSSSVEQAKEDTQSFELNEEVEVYCGSRKQWLASVVVEILPTGSVHVDCGAFRKMIPQSQCTAGSIRKAAPRPAPSRRTGAFSEKFASRNAQELNRQPAIMQRSDAQQPKGDVSADGANNLLLRVTLSRPVPDVRASRVKIPLQATGLLVPNRDSSSIVNDADVRLPVRVNGSTSNTSSTVPQTASFDAAKEDTQSFELNEEVEVYCGSCKQWLASVFVEILYYFQVLACGLHRTQRFPLRRARIDFDRLLIARYFLLPVLFA